MSSRHLVILFSPPCSSSSSVGVGVGVGVMYLKTGIMSLLPHLTGPDISHPSCVESIKINPKPGRPHININIVIVYTDNPVCRASKLKSAKKGDVSSWYITVSLKEEMIRGYLQRLILFNPQFDKCLVTQTKKRWVFFRHVLSCLLLSENASQINPFLL